MPNKYTFIVLLLLAVDAALVATLLLHGHDIAVLNPKGLIALKERNLIVTAIFLMLLVVIPAVTLTFFIAWKYRASNTKAHYAPDSKQSIFFELSWWAAPS